MAPDTTICYVLNKTESGELSLAATCIDPKSGRTMEVYTH